MHLAADHTQRASKQRWLFKLDVTCAHAFWRDLAVRAGAVLLLVLFVSDARGQAPRIQGRFETEIKTGYFRGDVCLSDLPYQTMYTFVLNRGLNIREVRAAGTGQQVVYDGAYNAVGVGDATQYTIREPVGEEGFCVSYVGAFPVYHVDEGERSVDDWKGLIAFDGRTVRAAEQTRFYPVLEDSTMGAQAVAVSYDVEVYCVDCASIYFNGSAPAAGPRASFVSAVPRQLFLYAGAFPYSSEAGLHFVGAEVAPEDAEVLRSSIGAIARIHERYLDIPYKDVPAYLTFASVSRTRELGRTTWGFVTWPTLALDGRTPFTSLIEIDTTTGRRALKPHRIDFLGHELAHHYFGARFIATGPLKWFLTESTADFMGLRAVREILGDEAYAAIVRGHYSDVVVAGDIVPLNKVQVAERIGGGYRYTLGPLLLIVLEQYLGTEAVRQTLRSFIIDPPRGDIDYAVFRSRLEAAGASRGALTRFEAECLVSRPWEGCLAPFESGIPPPLH